MEDVYQVTSDGKKWLVGKVKQTVKDQPPFVYEIYRCNGTFHLAGRLIGNQIYENRKGSIYPVGAVNFGFVRKLRAMEENELVGDIYGGQLYKYLPGVNRVRVGEVSENVSTDAAGAALLLLFG